jgi:hypothetical protein
MSIYTKSDHDEENQLPEIAERKKSKFAHEFDPKNKERLVPFDPLLISNRNAQNFL